MRVLVVHQNFPGQFRHVAAHWSKRRDWQLIGLGRESAPGMPGVDWLKYHLPAKPPAGLHGYLRQMDGAVRHGQEVARALLELKRRGFKPDVVLAHPGWGETLYLRDVFPDSKLIHFCEWYYDPQGADMGFDPEFPITLNDRARVRTWNALHSLNLTSCDVGISPTAWQRDAHPAIFRPGIALIHEGIDTEHLGPNPAAHFTLPNGTRLRAGDPVITYVARNLEPYRGFHSFMRALAIIQRQHPTCQALIVGGDGVSYGRAPVDAPHWRAKLCQEVRLDPERTHFLGKIPYPAYRQVLQVSAAHVYLTYPFVLSWSMLEAMASGCLVIGSRTPPVEEVLRHGENGWLVDFFDQEAIAARVVQALEEPQEQIALRERALHDVRQRFSHRAGMAGYDELLRRVVGFPGPVVIEEVAA